jgi:hypothetical protein
MIIFAADLALKYQIYAHKSDTLNQNQHESNRNERNFTRHRK